MNPPAQGGIIENASDKSKKDSLTDNISERVPFFGL